MEYAENFIRTYEDSGKEVINILDSRRHEQIKQNRERHRPIIESLIYLGRQNISLRGHRDHGKLEIGKSSTSSDANEGNFRQLLIFRVSSEDHELKSHLESCSSKATYISKNIQNQWTERHDSVLKFKVCFVHIVDSLHTISTWKDANTSSKAQSLMASVLSTNFITALYALSFVLSITLNLSRVLQKKSLDKSFAKLLIDDILSVLRDNRQNADASFTKLFKEIDDCQKKLDIPL
ncbi:hypothetical protein NQ314_019244 [Rhamnusium bicolor]|uniref:DUF4371 domain-containing protein n=1 Tax=Rhamnusium bicolor TaxID=1586634 RepID=A0AAV8WPV3_9CUCU|nr:hypothetical protein NQ314_019244 [Rhamnusium bicolor]